VLALARALAIPVVGLGGIRTGEDAAEFLIAGAQAVQVGTASFYDPAAPARVGHELERWCRRQGVATARELVGSLAP
jgi:dihydroorotate dehydrogenase (NAD+) catalytic subunit